MDTELNQVVGLVRAAVRATSRSEFLEAAADLVAGRQRDPPRDLADIADMLAELVGRCAPENRGAIGGAAVLDASPLPAAIISSDGRVLSCNFAFGSLLGLEDPAAAVGASLASLNLFDDAELLKTALQAATAGHRWDAGLSLQSGDEAKSCDAVLTSIGVSATDELLLTMYDRTDELRIQREAIAQEKLATAGEIASGVAHEVNNPLAAIRIEAELIAASVADETTAASARVIIREVDRASRIARTLIQITRRADRELRDVQLNDLIQEVLVLRSQLAQWQNIELRMTLDHELPTIVGPRADLRQVIFNLITNAEDAVLHVDRAIVEVCSGRVDGGIRITVSDSGSGISPDIQQRIFDPFFTTKDPDKGTGLGLSLSHGVIAEMGGKIWVEDCDLGGARFVVSLPSEPDE